MADAVVISLTKIVAFLVEHVCVSVFAIFIEDSKK